MNLSKEAMAKALSIWMNPEVHEEADWMPRWEKILQAAYAIDFAALQAHCQALGETLEGIAEDCEEVASLKGLGIGEVRIWKSVAKTARAALDAARKAGLLK